MSGIERDREAKQLKPSWVGLHKEPNVKTILTLLIALVVLLCCLCAYFMVSSIAREHTLVIMDKKNQQELERTIAREKELIRKDLEEKYAADIVSYDAMAKRLELEKQKARELEAKLKASAPAAKKEGE